MEPQNYVVLVDESDNELGVMEKNQAHHEGILHRAVSVFIFNTKGEWLLQKRASHKYHSPGEWSNTSCTHPFKGESYLHAAQRRVVQEMGISPHIEEKFHFIYKAVLDNRMTEHELDTIFIGISDASPLINKEEVSDYRYLSTDALSEELQQSPESFTPWFRKLFPRILELIGNQEVDHLITQQQKNKE